MAELSKIFKNNDLYEAWRDNKDIPSNVMAVVLNADRDAIDKVAFSTNDIDGDFRTYEIEKTKPTYANNNNVYVCHGIYNFQYDSTCFLQKANIKNEFDWPILEEDIYTEPFEFTLYGINAEVDINNIELYWGESVGNVTTWRNVFANNKPINFVKNSDGSYTCTVWFNEITAIGYDNFFIAYRLPSSIGSGTIDVTPYIIGWWDSSAVTTLNSNQE